MIVHRSRQFGSPLDAVTGAASKFAQLSQSYLAGLQRLGSHGSRVAQLESQLATLPQGPERAAIADKVKFLRSEVTALGAGRSLIEPALTKARSLLAHLFPDQFGQFDPVSITITLAAAAGAAALLTAWIKRENNVSKELGVEEKKVQLVTQHLAPPDILKQAGGDGLLGGLFGDVKKLAAIGIGIWALVTFGPALLKRSRLA